ncbi:unnamed protein product, partial [Arabidopsis halleri]
MSMSLLLWRMQSLSSLTLPHCRLGKKRMNEEIESNLHGLTKYEEKALETIKPKLKADIE